MLIKNILLLAGISILALAHVSAQESQPQAKTPGSAPQWSNRDMTYRGKNYDVLDSAYYPKSRRKQFKKYIDHQEMFPPKPRNMWEAGIGFGLYNVIGNVPTLMLWDKGGGGFNVHVRKSLGYIFSMRLEYIYGVGKNLDRSGTTGYDAPYTSYGYVPSYWATPALPANSVYRSTRMEASQLSLDLMLNFYNINFHNARNQVSFFTYFGIGALGYKTRVNALDGSYKQYNFGTIVTNPSDKNKVIRKALQSKMDKSYETAADNNSSSTILDKKTLDFAPSLGAGFQYRINKQFNVQVEDRYTFPSDGYLDGTNFGRPLGNTVAPGRANDAINYFSVGLNYNIKNKKKSVEPLYWINPLDHAYNELSYPRHMILPNPVLPDEDNDGITDQFDKCPKTPKNIAVDAHGCPLDTDGDGVPDYKDKQLITPTECQPVDADGVGHCPCPDDCQGKMGGTKGGAGPCGSIGAGTLLFTGNSAHISTGMQAQLATLAGQMQANPLCKVVIIGGGSGSKVKEQRSWEHVNAVIEHMSEKNNISRERFIFKYGEAGDENIVTYRPANADEAGSPAINVPPPHPDLK
jgi:OOP family OmpA-OmpF porin